MSAPGWYPQHDGTERYYDGAQWTEHSRPLQGGQSAIPQPPQKDSGPWKWIAIIVGIIVVGCLGLCLLGAVFGDDSSLDSSSSSTSSDSTASGSDATSSSASPSNASATKTVAKPTGAKKTSSATSSSPAAAAPAGPDYTTTAGALIKEFEGNELAGDQKYKGKTVQVSGVVEKIDTELFNDEKYLLNITDGGDFEFLSVTCHDMSNDVLSKLSVGSAIKVIGDFDDGGDLGVDLKNCRVI